MVPYLIPNAFSGFRLTALVSVFPECKIRWVGISGNTSFVIGASNCLHRCPLTALIMRTLIQVCVVYF